MNKTLAIVTALSALFSSACSDKKKSDPAKDTSASSTDSKTKDSKIKDPAKAKAAISELFSAKAPSKTSVYWPKLHLGMKHADAEKLRAAGAETKSEYFQLGYVASDDVSIDSFYYVHLPKEGVVELGNAAWGPAVQAPSDTGADKYFWFNPAEGIRAYAWYDKRMDWTMLTFDHYLAGESFAKDGLFVFENGSSLLGKTEEAVSEQLTRSDYDPKTKSAFIPPTAFAEVNKIQLEYGEDGNAQSFSFALYFLDSDHKERLLAGLVSGFGEGSMKDGEIHYKAEGRTLAVVAGEDKLKVTVSAAK